MKWYSIKTHRPPYDTQCLIRRENTMVYEIAIFLGCNSDVDIDYSKNWYSHEYSKKCETDSRLHIDGVTHFCIPDPIEIESQDLSECDHDYKGKVFTYQHHNGLNSSFLVNKCSKCGKIEKDFTL